MLLSEFQGKHKGEECLIICNGPSLTDIPLSFLKQRPSFAMNYMPLNSPKTHGELFLPTYWVCIDKPAIEHAAEWEPLRNTPKFIFAKQFRYWEGDENTIWWMNKRDVHDGFVFDPQWGVYYTTTAHAACWLAYLMGFEVILTVGLDCTANNTPQLGKTGHAPPHAWDDEEFKVRAASGWDAGWGNMRRWLNRNNVALINLSTKTMCTTVPRDDWNDWQSGNGNLQRFAPWRGSSSPGEWNRPPGRFHGLSEGS